MQQCQSRLRATAQHVSTHVDFLIKSAIELTPSTSTMESRALKFSLARLMRNEILICSVQRHVPAAADAYRKLMSENDFRIAFREANSCDGNVFIAIMDITDLEIWRRDQVASGTLSIRGLVSRAAEIESRVEQIIHCLSDLLHEHPSTAASSTCLSADKSSAAALNPDSMGTDRLHHIQTYIFAHSILTEIHKIVSGPRARVPETSHSIERSLLVAWKLLSPDTMSLRSLAWPYCVSFSLATEAQRDVFHTMAVDAEQFSTTEMQELRYAVESCWAEMEKPAAASSDGMASCPDWKDVLQRSNSLGVLLL